jgi:hypothetical protein
VAVVGKKMLLVGVERERARRVFWIKVPELYARLNPMPFEAAERMEIDLAEDLRRAGYAVTGEH